MGVLARWTGHHLRDDDWLVKLIDNAEKEKHPLVYAEVTGLGKPIMITRSEEENDAVKTTHYDEHGQLWNQPNPFHLTIWIVIQWHKDNEWGNYYRKPVFWASSEAKAKVFIKEKKAQNTKGWEQKYEIESREIS